MSFDTSALSAYVDNNSKKIALKTVTKPKTAKLLIDNSAVQYGVKGSAAILKMSNTVSIQSAATCGARNAAGTTVLSSKQITVAPIKDESNLCPKALYSTFFAQTLAQGNAPDSGFTPEFAATIMDNRTSLFAVEVEKMIWQGDLSATGTTSLKYIDGIAKQVGSNGIAITASGSDMVAKLQSIYMAMPVSERTQDDFRIFIGEEKYDEYMIALANKNLFNAADPFKILGTSAKVEVVSGLDYANKAFAARISNFQLGLDGTEDSSSLSFSKETNQWYCDINSAIGVAVVDASVVGVATI